MKKNNTSNTSKTNQLIDYLTSFVDQLETARSGDEVRTILENVEILISQNDDVSDYRGNLLGTLNSVRKHQATVSDFTGSLNALIEDLKELPAREAKKAKANEMRKLLTALADKSEEILSLLYSD